MIPNDNRMLLPKKDGFPYLPYNSYNVVDLNTIHESLSGGLFLLYCTPNTLNIPDGVLGLCLHSQRVIGTNVTNSQLLTQLFMYGGAIYFRTGRGNGTQISWYGWEQLG